MATIQLPAVQLPTGVTPQPQGVTSQQTLEKMKKLVKTPELPVGGKLLAPQALQARTVELPTTPGVATTAPTAATPTAPTTPTITPSVAPTTAAVTDPATMAAQQYTATTVGTAPTMAAAQGTVTQPMTAETGQIAADATVTGQLAGLQSQITNALTTGTNLPSWALGAQKLVEANMAKRGMGASSMYAEALAQGVMQAATPIAVSYTHLTLPTIYSV